MEIEQQQPDKLKYKNQLFDILKTYQVFEQQQSNSRNVSYVYNYEKKFILPAKKQYEVQYCHLYYNRLLSLKNIIKLNLEQKNINSIESIIQIKENINCYVIGTLYKEMKLKPNVLTKMNAPMKIDSKLNNFTDSTDQLYLEDNYGRIKLQLNNTMMEQLDGSFRKIEAINLTSGIIVALEGKLEENNYFTVNQIICGGLAEQNNENNQQIFLLPKEPNIKTTINNNYNNLEFYLNSNNTDKFIVLTSGLELNQDNKDFSYLSFYQFLKGNTINGQLLNVISFILNYFLIQLCLRFERLVIAGNILANQEDLDCALIGSYRMKDIYQKVQLGIQKSMREADDILENLSQTIQVDLMPGENDPTTSFMPQQPINKCYFSKSSKSPNMNYVCNPYDFSMNSLKILGTSGQNVTDMKKYSTYSNDDIDLVELQITWSHIAPTAPDTLQCYPYSDEDKFFLEKLPHVYFVGNCDKFQTKMLYQKSTKKFCRIICVPKFVKTKSVIIMNLTNLDTFELAF